MNQYPPLIENGDPLREAERDVDVMFDEQHGTAELVVDASGRDSRAPEWLECLGYTPPEKTTINGFPGYATRIYQRPPSFAETWKAIYIQPTPPDVKRGGAILPLEGDTWQVVMIGMGGDYPPIDEAGYLEYARTLPSLGL